MSKLTVLLGIFIMMSCALSAAESFQLEILELQSKPFVTRDGLALRAELPENTVAETVLASFRVELGHYAGAMLTGVVHAEWSLSGERPGGGVRIAYRADDNSHDRLGGGVRRQGKFAGDLSLSLGLDPYATSCQVELLAYGGNGYVLFDLSTLRFETLFPRNDGSYKCEYSATLLARPRRRGVMSPIIDQANEDNFKVLHDWKVNLLRLQLNTSTHIASTPALYQKFIDEKIEKTIPAVLDLGARYGIAIIIDLHTVPSDARMTDNSDAIYGDEQAVSEFVAIWKRMAEKFHKHPALYGYDLINEPRQQRRAKYDYWEIQRLAAEAIRAVDPETPIYLEANLMDSPLAFPHLRPLELPNIIYQIHFYEPFDYTHHFVQRQEDLNSGKEVSRNYPGTYYGTYWGSDLVQIKKKLSYVRDFEAKHGAKIFVGEFSVFAGAPGAEQYLADCIQVFEEYNWDWTYHAFREAKIWSVEHEGVATDVLTPSNDTARKRVLLNSFLKNQQ